MGRSTGTTAFAVGVMLAAIVYCPTSRPSRAINPCSTADLAGLETRASQPPQDGAFSLTPKMIKCAIKLRLADDPGSPLHDFVIPMSIGHKKAEIPAQHFNIPLRYLSYFDSKARFENGAYRAGNSISLEIPWDEAIRSGRIDYDPGKQTRIAYISMNATTLGWNERAWNPDYLDLPRSQSGLYSRNNLCDLTLKEIEDANDSRDSDPRIVFIDCYGRSRNGDSVRAECTIFFHKKMHACLINGYSGGYITYSIETPHDALPHWEAILEEVAWTIGKLRRETR
ncbi:hypothetical protein [Oleomonas cavernae]|uniref:hypothetical protein n=1 Tax=Oleomonas cavernae TaxID=2320859 RepID=UPI0011C4182F|nr:hypothetical protein [Oleomonas cavernae]